MNKANMTWQKLLDNKQIVAYKQGKQWFELAIPEKKCGDTIGTNFHDVEFLKDGKPCVNGEPAGWHHLCPGEQPDNLDEYKECTFKIFDSLEDFSEKTKIECLRLNYCHYCETYFEGDPEDQDLLVNSEMCCPECFASAFLENDAEDYIFNKDTFNPNSAHFEGAKYLHFDYRIIYNHFKVLNWNIVESGWVGSMDGYNWDSSVDDIKNVMKPKEKYLVMLDRASHNCCSISWVLLEKH